MKVVIAGGSGHLGSALTQTFERDGHDVLILSRRPADQWNVVIWDGKTVGEWAKAIDGADAVINLAGHSVLCPYTPENRKLIMNSRIDSVRAVGQAIEMAQWPPRVWVQMSTANIYAHRFDEANDETTGVLGGREAATPSSWRFGVSVACAWEQAFVEMPTPHTRKVALRTAAVMAARRGGAFDMFSRLARCGLGGRMGSGKQYVSWIHSYDFERAVKRLIRNEKLMGAFNICAPHPLPNADFMYHLRREWGALVGLPMPTQLLEFGSGMNKIETEHILKSRRVAPARLLKAGFEFVFPTWPQAATDLVTEWRRRYGKDKEA